MPQPQRPLLLLAALALLAPAARAHAQTIDSRLLSPNVMLLMDTSGSMERVGSCACTTPSCTECLPTCSNVAGSTNTMNRWATVLAAMTGTWPAFTCRQDARPTSGTPDAGYYLPHFTVTSATQTANGILDTYATRVKFGLMTFDNIGSLNTQGALVTSLSAALSQGPAGDYSYGPDKPFTVPGCATPYVINNGARNATAPIAWGPLMSPGGDSVDTISSSNAIQASLLAMRPYGATPTAGMFSDLEYFYANDASVRAFNPADGTGDRYRTCRKNYVIFLTDGYPNADMRGVPYGCDDSLGGGACPYDTAETSARRLCVPDGSNRCTGIVDGIFVIGFNVSGDANTIQNLNALAAAGGTGAAIFADDLNSLRNAIAAALDQAAPNPTSQSVPAIASSSSGAAQMQSQINAGYRVAGSDATSSPGGPWEGILERHRTVCNGLTPTQVPIDSTDRFQTVLNGRSSPRRLLTVVPAVGNATGFLRGNGVDTSLGDLAPSSSINLGTGSHGTGGPSCAPNVTPPSGAAINPLQSSLAIVDFNAAAFAGKEALLGAGTTSAQVAATVSWIAGDRGTLSDLGDIYHSAPLVVSAPAMDTGDESFNAFRRRPEVANRPTVIYVGTNDGILHAFLADAATVTINGVSASYPAGYELWGFIPPAAFPMLRNATTQHVWTVDGSPYVREVFFRRTPGQDGDGNLYHTVLVVPMGMGGGSYFALDVTDPGAPKFMWQFSTGSTEMGATRGTPALAQVKVDGASSGYQERLVALLPGGSSSALTTSCTAITGGDSWMNPIACPPSGVRSRPLNDSRSGTANHYRCWGTQGRHLYFLDAGRGTLIGQLGSEVFNAPLSGGVSVDGGDVGTLASRAFVSDADATLWRVDMSSTNVAKWDAIPFVDMFSDLRSAGLSAGGQPSYNPPVLSMDQSGRMVVIQGTGDPDYVDGAAPNRVVSYTENLNYAASPPTVSVTKNWILPLGQYSGGSPTSNYGELVTGPIQLYGGVVYFTSVRTTATATNACGSGTSYLWGVDYAQGAPAPRLVQGAGVVSNVSLGDTLVMGVALNQGLTCRQVDPVQNVYDPYAASGSRNASTLSATNGGQRQATALTTGSGSGSGSTLTEITRTLPSAPTTTRVSGFATRAE